MCDQDKSKVSNRAWDWESIRAWEFYPIIVPTIEASLMSHPTPHEGSPVFDHIQPLMPIKIHAILKLSK